MKATKPRGWAAGGGDPGDALLRHIAHGLDCRHVLALGGRHEEAGLRLRVLTTGDRVMTTTLLREALGTVQGLPAGAPVEGSAPLADAWTAFEAAVVHRDAGDAQRSAMRQAFYGGALAVFSLMLAKVSGGEEITDADLAMMNAMHAELEGFAAAGGQATASDPARGRA